MLGRERIRTSGRSTDPRPRRDFLRADPSATATEITTHAVTRVPRPTKARSTTLIEGHSRLADVETHRLYLFLPSVGYSTPRRVNSAHLRTQRRARWAALFVGKRWKAK